jgi:pimeloyl-ACP methyl ester carboxylesterase
LTGYYLSDNQMNVNSQVTKDRHRRMLMPRIHYRAADIGGLKISYREAGPPDAPTLLLLHGFPTAGHMFRDLMPLLAGSLHLVAPDLPGFGQSDLPPRDTFKYHGCRHRIDHG